MKEQTKLCAYCGQENPLNAVSCRQCGTAEFRGEAAAPSSEPEPVGEGARLVTLMTCRTLAEADLVKSELRAAGIPAFIPDEFLMQAICFNVNTYGFVRVQVPAGDYEAAKEVLATPPAE